MTTAHQTFIGAVVLVTAVSGAWLALQGGLSLLAAGVVMLIIPTAVITMLAAIYVTVAGWERRGAGPAEPGHERSRMGFVPGLVLGVVVFSLAIGVIYVASNNQAVLAIWLGIASSLVAACGALWLRQMLAGVNTSGGQVSAQDVLTRRFRVVLFAFVVAAPAALTLVFFDRGNPQATVIFAAIAVAMVPWSVKKVKAEWRHHPR